MKKIQVTPAKIASAIIIIALFSLVLFIAGCKEDSGQKNGQQAQEAPEKPDEESETFCNADVDCIPKPGCHARECINEKYEGEYEKPEFCTQLFDCKAAYKKEDCICLKNKCENNNIYNDCEEQEQIKLKEAVEETKESEAEVTESTQPDSEYYKNLLNDCTKRASFDCCNKSVSGMEKGSFMLAPLEGCQKGQASKMLTCIGSYKWCEPVNETLEEEMTCEANADCTPKPECHPKDCINVEYESRYVKPTNCSTEIFIWEAITKNNCYCANKKCVNSRYN